MYILKQIPEDFVVDEILDISPGQKGGYAYYHLKKKGMTTPQAITRAARLFHVPVRVINYCGLKDKDAVTTQYISVREGVGKNKEGKDISLHYLGRGKDRLAVGMLSGNRFRITVRNLDTAPKPIDRMLNLFGEQRFGHGGMNAEIGFMLIKNKFSEAARALAVRHHDVADALEENPTNAIGAIRSLSKRIQLLYIHAAQSALWNQAAVHPAAPEMLPLIGFETELSPAEETVYTPILEKESLRPEDFVIRQLQGLSACGDQRKVRVELRDLEISFLQEDDLNRGKKKCVVGFSLPKGSYATVAIIQMCC
ncbi:MAG: tRNA pseudouridine(13) synthase TruD [archaeon]